MMMINDTKNKKQYTSHKNKSRLVIAEYVGYIFWQFIFAPTIVIISR